MYYFLIIPAWLHVCPATRLVLQQLHVAIHLPPSQMDLCHFGRCFTALIHCSNCFMLAHLGLVVERAFLDHFIRMHFWCHRIPIPASWHDKRLMMTQFSGLILGILEMTQYWLTHCASYGRCVVIVFYYFILFLIETTLRWHFPFCCAGILTLKSFNLFLTSYQMSCKKWNRVLTLERQFIHNLLLPESRWKDAL